MSVVAVGALAVSLLAACGDDDGTATTTVPPATTAAPDPGNGNGPDGTEPPDPGTPNASLPGGSDGLTQQELLQAWAKAAEIGGQGLGPLKEALWELMPSSMPYAPTEGNGFTFDFDGAGIQSGAAWDGVCAGDSWFTHMPFDRAAEQSFDHPGAVEWFRTTATALGWETQVVEGEPPTFIEDELGVRFLLRGGGQTWVVDIMGREGDPSASVRYCPSQP